MPKQKNDDGGWWFWSGFYLGAPIWFCAGFGIAVLFYHTWDFGTGVMVGICGCAIMAFLLFAYISDHIEKKAAKEITLQIKRNLVDWYETQGLTEDEAGNVVEIDDADWWKRKRDGQDPESSGPD